MKKIMSIVLAILLIINMAGADASYASPNTIIKVNSIDTSSKYVDVDVAIEGNPGLAAYDVKVEYDDIIFAPREGMDVCTPAASFDGVGSFEFRDYDGGCEVLWFDVYNVDTDGILFTLHLEVKEEVPYGDYPIKVTAVSKNIIDADENLVPVVCEDGVVTYRDYIPLIYGGTISSTCVDEIEFPIMVQDNPGFAGISLNVEFDTDMFEPVMESSTEIKINRSDDFPSGIMLAAKTQTGCKVIWSDSQNNKKDGVIGYLLLKANDNCPVGEYDFLISYNEEDTLDYKEDPVSFTCKNGKVSYSHSAMEKIDAVAPKCEEDGNIDYWYCADCDRYYLDSLGTEATTAESIIDPATGHDIVSIPAQEATCTEDGFSEYSYCTICNTVFSEKIDYPALGHDFTDGICSRCDEYDGETTITGTLAEYLTWSFMPTGELIVRGQGEIPDYDSYDLVPWNIVRSYVTKVIISGDIESIGKNALGMLENVNSIDFLGTAEDFAGVTIETGNDIFDALTPNFYHVVSSINLSATDEIDLTKTTAVQVECEIVPSDSISNILFTSSDSNIAEVDENGMVTFHKDGKVTITATADDYYAVQQSVDIEAYYYTKQMDLEISSDVSTKAVPVGTELKLVVRGGREMEDGEVYFASSNEQVATVDEHGNVTTLAKGVAIIAAKLVDDPYERGTSILINVISPIANEYIAINGTKVTAEGLNLEMLSDKRTYQLSVEEKTQSYTFATTDKTVAQISGTKLIIPGKANGECTITATSKDKKTVLSFPVSVKNYTPRLGATTVTLNNNVIAGVSTMLQESYGKSINHVELHDYVSKTVSEEETQKITYDYADETLYIKDATDLLKNGKSAKFQIWVYFDDPELEVNKSLSITVKRADAYPSVTVKQSAKLNFFYTDATTDIAFTGKNAKITDVSIVEGTSSYEGAFSDGVLRVRDTGVRIKKKIAGGKVDIFFEGYKGYKRQSLSVTTTTKAPALKLSATSGTIFTGIDDKSVTVTLSGAELEAGSISTTNASTVLTLNGDKLTIRYEGTKKANITISVQNSNWQKPVKLTYTMNVISKTSTLPKVSLKATTLTINNRYTAFGASTAVTLDQKNVHALPTDLQPKGSKVTDTLNVFFDGSIIKVDVKDGMVPVKGKYAYTFKPQFDDGREAKSAITLYVNVVDTKATASVKASGKLDLIRRDASGISYKVTLKNVSSEVTGVSLTGTDADKFDVCLDTASKNTVKLLFKDGIDYAVKKYKVGFVLTVDGVPEEVKTSTQTVSVTQSALKVSGNPATLTVYQSKMNGNTLTFNVSVKSPEGAAIDEAYLGKISSSLQKMLAESGSNVSWTYSNDGQTVYVHVKLNDMSKLVAGKTYTLPITIAPKDAINTKANASIKLTIKVKK